MEYFYATFIISNNKIRVPLRESSHPTELYKLGEQ